MRNPHLVFVLMITFMVAPPATAEIYKYVDDNGQHRWTDDLGQVPEAQRISAQRYSSVEETQANRNVDQTAQAQPDETNDTVAGKAGDSGLQTRASISRDALEKEKANLDAQYQALVEERKQLETVKAGPTNFKTRTQLNIRIAEYNAKTEKYEAQLNQFNEKIRAYNQKIMSKNTQPSE